MKHSREPDPRRQTWTNALLLVLGVAVAAIAFNTLILPNSLAPGGVVGIAVLLAHYTSLNPAWLMAAFNLSLLGLGWAMLGRAFALRSLAGSLLLPLFVWLTAALPPLTHERLLAAIVGGALLGAGIGLVFKANSSIGGFSTLGLVAQRRFGIRVDHTLLALDFTVLTAALLLFPPEAALCAYVCSFILAKAARGIMTGGTNAQVAWVFSQHSARLRELTLTRLDLGLTQLPGRGGFSDQPTDVLMVVMRPSDVPRFKSAIKEVDPAAFVVLAEANEVLGYGFTSI